MSNKKLEEQIFTVQSSYRPIFENLQKKIMFINLFILIACFLVECIFCVAYIKYNLMETLTTSQYISFYIIKPTIINIVVYMLGILILKIKNINDENKLTIPILVMSIILTNLIITHWVFPCLYIVLIGPIFISIIYGKESIEKKTFYMCFGLLTIAYISILFDDFTPSPDKYYFNVILSYIVLIFSHAMANKLVKYEKDKETTLLQSISKNRELENELLHDGLTKLYNHNALFSLLENVIEKEITKYLHIAVIDIDYFKKVNDVYGHESGNEVLIKLAKKLSELSNENIFPARYGGEEFAIVFMGINMKKTIELMEKLRIEIANQKIPILNNNNITISIGIAGYEKGLTPNEFFIKADEALYTAKKTGRNKVEVYKIKQI